jgi:hypothetical protein
MAGDVGAGDGKVRAGPQLQAQRPRGSPGARVDDSLGNLSNFETKVRLNDLPLMMRVLGRVDGPELRLKIQSGEITHEMSYPVPSQMLLTNELIPEPKLLQIYVGQMALDV